MKRFLLIALTVLFIGCNMENNVIPLNESEESSSKKENETTSENFFLNFQFIDNRSTNSKLVDDFMLIFFHNGHFIDGSYMIEKNCNSIGGGGVDTVKIAHLINGDLASSCLTSPIIGTIDNFNTPATSKIEVIIFNFYDDKITVFNKNLFGEKVFYY